MSQWRVSKLLGLGLQSNQPHRPADKLLHLLVNADNGAILALIGHREMLIPEKIEDSPTRLAGREPRPEEKENVQLALKNRQFVLKSRVETESGHRLGKVFDFEFDDISWKIERIFVSDRLLFRALVGQLQIPKADILFIGKDKVIVRDGLVKRESKERAVQPREEYVGVGSGAELMGK